MRYLEAGKDQSAPDALYCGQGPKEIGNKKESDLVFIKESFRSVLKDLLSGQ